jgi:2-polyprenyl-6-hydroxyphenyl methylase/3-demethylubiquinone-9 3-methyltransferase
MENAESIDGYRWADGELTGAHSYLLPTIERLLKSAVVGARLIDLGCGNGSVTAYCSELGYDVVGVDPSVEGVAQARCKHPSLTFHQASAYDNLASMFGTFDCVLSLEVVEHVYAPRKYAATVYSLCKEGGVVIVSTPYHGYFKNLALALSGKMDRHFTALWDHGHIKFWSVRTLTMLLKEAGFKEVGFHFVGRFPALAKSMVAVARR